MASYPFSDALRDQLANSLVMAYLGTDPLIVVQQNIFRRHPHHNGSIPDISGRTPFSFYKEVVQYCEMAAWSEDPALIIELLGSLALLNAAYQAKINDLLKEGPFR